MTGISERFFKNPGWKESFQLVPDSIGSAWSQRLDKFLKTPVPEEWKTYSEWMFQMVKELKDADVKIMAGTDTPIFFLTPGYSLHEELALLVKGGLTPMEAINAATLQPAMYFQMEDELGTIAEGMLADLVLLDANPLENIRNTKRINAVIKDGKLHDKLSLDSFQQKSKNQ